MQEAFRPEHLKQDVECARVDFSCFTFEQDLKAKSYWLGNPLPCTAGFFSGSWWCWITSTTSCFQAGLIKFRFAIGLPTTGCGVPPDCEKSYRKIAVAFTPQAGTAFSGS
jgi:hypothetical protein